jgi:hypothetical protein
VSSRVISISANVPLESIRSVCPADDNTKLGQQILPGPYQAAPIGFENSISVDTNNVLSPCAEAMTDRPNDQYMATTDEAASGGAHIGDEEPIFTDSGSSRVQGSVASVNKISSTSKFCRQSPLLADPEDNVPTGAPLPWNGNLHLAQERSLLHLPNSPFSARQAPNSPGLSNIRQLRFFLESRQVAVGEEMPSKLTDNSQVEVLQHDATGPVTTTSDDPTATPKIPEATIPLDIRSESIVLPSDWNVPTEAHHYVASLSLLQRRALVQCMQEDCNILLTEISDSTGPELIID